MKKVKQLKGWGIYQNNRKEIEEYGFSFTVIHPNNMEYDWFGFAKEKIRIIRSVSTYEINRHNRLRKTGEIERLPAYNATDWNYIRFNCGSVGYELYNDQIRLFVD